MREATTKALKKEIIISAQVMIRMTMMQIRRIPNIS